MKRGTLLLGLIVLFGLTAWAGVRLDVDSGDLDGLPPAQPSFEFDLQGGTGEEISTVLLGEVQPPSLLAVLSVTPLSVLTRDPVVLDASESIPGNGEISSYEWDLDGDGAYETASAEARRTVSFEQDGEVSIRVRVSNSEGETSTSNAFVLEVSNRAPNASFRVMEEELIEGREIRFSDLSMDADGSVESWLWNFGDGTTSVEANPLHTYEMAGSYRVALTVIDDDGLESESVSMEIEVQNLAPHAAFTVLTSEPRVEESVLFRDESEDASLEGKIIHVAWDYGDGVYMAGGPSSDGVYAHVYEQPGAYRVTLYVIDDAGAMASVELIVNVK